MKIIVEFDTENSSFVDDDWFELVGIADQVSKIIVDKFIGEQQLRDVNGNIIGKIIAKKR